MRTAYRLMLRLYPADYRVWFEKEMSAAFEEALQDRRSWLWALSELAGLTIGAAADWTAKLTSSTSIRGRTLPDVRLMRPPGVPRELWFGSRER